MNKKCFGEGTRIQMYGGYSKLIEDIKVNDSILDSNNYKLNVKKIIKGCDILYKIIDLDYNYSYRVTENHLLTLTDNKGNIIDLSIKEYLKNKNKIYYGFRSILDFKNKYFDNDQIDEYVNLLCNNITNEEIIDHIDNDYLYNSIEIRNIFLSKLILKLKNYKVINGNIVFYVPIYHVKFIDDILFICYSLLLNPTTERDNLFVEITLNTCTNSFFLYLDKVLDEDSLDILEDDNISLYNIKVIKDKSESNYYGLELDNNSRFLLWDSTVVNNTYKN